MKYNNKMEKWVEVGYEHVEPSDGVPSDENGNSGESTEKFVVFHVRDNGIGILPKHHDTVFRIFKRLHGRDEFGGGTGAGLTIARKIVERHGGRIWLDSQPAEGTTVYFTLTGDHYDDARQTNSASLAG